MFFFVTLSCLCACVCLSPSYSLTHTHTHTHTLGSAKAVLQLCGCRSPNLCAYICHGICLTTAESKICTDLTTISLTQSTSLSLSHTHTLTVVEGVIWQGDIEGTGCACPTTKTKERGAQTLRLR